VAGGNIVSASIDNNSAGETIATPFLNSSGTLITNSVVQLYKSDPSAPRVGPDGKNVTNSEWQVWLLMMLGQMFADEFSTGGGITSTISGAVSDELQRITF